MDEKKNTLRATVLARRDELAPEVRALKSETICRVVEKLTATALLSEPDTEQKPCIAAYAAMKSEVDVQPLVEAALAHGWEIAFPCMVRDEVDGVEAAGEAGAASRMAFYCVPRERWEEARETFLDHPLRCKSCAELEGADFREIAPCELDAVIVPLVAFDNAGNRLGYGGGNYDRLLPHLRPDALVVGVAFEEQRVDTVPCEPHDQPLPHVVSA